MNEMVEKYVQRSERMAEQINPREQPIGGCQAKPSRIFRGFIRVGEQAQTSVQSLFKDNTPNPWIQTKILTNYDTHTLAIRWCTVYRQGKVFSFPTTTNFFLDLDLSKILFHQHPLPQLKFMMQRIKISKLLVIAFRKHMTSRGLPTLRDVRVQRHRHSGNLRVSATD